MPNGNISMGVRVPFPQTFPQVRIQQEMQNSSMAGRHIFRFFDSPLRNPFFLWNASVWEDQIIVFLFTLQPNFLDFWSKW